MYLWEVKLNDRETVVTAEDKLSASKKAARMLGVVWRETARDMEFLRLRRVGKGENA